MERVENELGEGVIPENEGHEEEEGGEEKEETPQAPVTEGVAVIELTKGVKDGVGLPLRGEDDSSGEIVEFTETLKSEVKVEEALLNGVLLSERCGEGVAMSGEREETGETETPVEIEGGRTVREVIKEAVL